METSPMANELFPIISTPDLPRSLAFYRDLLGGAVTYEFPTPDGDAAYVSLSIGRSSLGIAADLSMGADATPARPISLWVYVDDCDATVEVLRAAGVRITAEPEGQPWGERVARVLDPDGNEVVIGAHAT
jgi:lactoylglutathione lyase